MGRRMSEQDWIDYRERVSGVVWPDGIHDVFGKVMSPAEQREWREKEKWGPLRCPSCDGPCLRSITTTLYPCEACDWGWYPADLDFADPRRTPAGQR